MNAVSFVHEQLGTKAKAALPSFKAGDNVTVNYKIIEGNKMSVFKVSKAMLSNAREQAQLLHLQFVKSATV